METQPNTFIFYFAITKLALGGNKNNDYQDIGQYIIISLKQSNINTLQLEVRSMFEITFKF